jgi:hypothetical protein
MHHLQRFRMNEKRCLVWKLRGRDVPCLQVDGVTRELGALVGGHPVSPHGRVQHVL